MAISKEYVYFLSPLLKTCSDHSLQDNVLIGNDHKAYLSDFGLAGFDRSRWLDITSNSSNPGGTIPYMAPELIHLNHEEGRLRIPLMKKGADVYALGMLIYEVRLLIANICGRRLNALLGLDRKKAVPRRAITRDPLQGFTWGATTTTFVGADSGPDLGIDASVLEQGADPEADSGERPHHVYGPHIAECTSGMANEEGIELFHG